MSDAASTLSTALSRLANDQRRTVSQYANLTARLGSARNPSRLLNDIGFYESIQFAYLSVHPAHVVPPDDEDPRTIRQFVLRPYGLQADLSRFQSNNRNIRSSRGPGLSGVATHPTFQEVVISAELSDTTYSAQKNATVRRNMTTRRPGPAYHFLIDRDGNIGVGPALDYQTAVSPLRAEDSLFIGLEGALGLLRTDFEEGDEENYFELPYTNAQVAVLVVLLAKLYTAYPDVPKSFNNAASAGTAATVYEGTSILPTAKMLNFLSSSSGLTTSSPFNYAPTSQTPVFRAVAQEGAYNLATEVFRTAAAPPAVAARDAARTAIGQVDTTGQMAVSLGAYGSIAAPERSSDMQGQTRQELFVSRGRMAHNQADRSGAQASGVAASSQALRSVHPTVTNDRPHVYDYDNGHWGDGEVY